MTRQDAFDEINKIQDEYIDQLITLMNNKDYEMMQKLNFTSPTGTGKTNMMAKLINRFPDYYFIITTLSKGQLHLQIRENLKKLVKQDNFYVYGSADYKIGSKLDANTIISQIPPNTKCIWLRDEGHIRTNRWDGLLENACYKVINFSATNTSSDIQCNFTSTMMLRTVNQTNGTPEDAINKLLKVKAAHKNVPNYNPCAIFRVVSGDERLYKMIVDLCNTHHLKYIDITEDEYVMQQLCEDDNENDVIINKFKIVEGIDIRRAHVLYMDNQPSNNATTIQVIGRCRRNALLYRDDIDILDPKNKNLLDNTRECYVYYNVEKMRIDEDENGELQYAFCNHISCQALKPNSVIEVKDGQLSNGLYIIELEGCTGKYEIKIDESTGFNIVSPKTDFYKQTMYQYENCIYIDDAHELYKVNTKWLNTAPLHTKKKIFDYSTGEYKKVDVDPGEEYIYVQEALGEYKQNFLYQLDEDSKEECKCIYDDYITYLEKLYIGKDELYEAVKDICIPGTTMTINTLDKKWFISYLDAYTKKYKDKHGYKMICRDILDICKSDDIISLIHAYMICYSQTQHITNVSYPHNILSIDLVDAKLIIAKWLYLDNNDNIDFHIPNSYYLINDYVHFLSTHSTYTDTDVINLFLSVIRKDFRKYTDYDFVHTFKNLLQRKYEKHNGTTTYFKIICDNKQKSIQSDIELVQFMYNLLVNGFIIPSIFIQDDSRLEKASLELKKYVHSYPIFHKFTLKDIQDLTKYKTYIKLYNDYESSIIGTDLMRQVKDDDTDEVMWIESKSVSSKIGNYNKFNSFISQRYKIELDLCKTQLCKGNNNFKLPTKCNSVIGYCVEYYSKYLVYGKDSLLYYIQMAYRESKLHYKPNTKVSDMLIIRACMLQYRANMVKCFGSGVSKVIKTISVSQMIRDEYKEFVNLVVALGKKTAKFVKKQLYTNGVTNNIDPNLSINHITGLADYITEDTILDVKVRGGIGEGEVRQVLAYHYLSTKRSDLHIKRVIVYDATSGRSVIVPISEKNQT